MCSSSRRIESSAVNKVEHLADPAAVLVVDETGDLKKGTHTVGWVACTTLTSRQRPAQQQTAADAALRRQLARERLSIPSGTPAQAPAPVRSTEPGGQPDWLVLGLGVLVAILALVAGVAVLAARRAGRKVRPSQAT